MVNVGAVHYPPYYDFSKDENNPTGFLVDYLNKRLQKGGLEVKWQRIPLVRGERALKKKVIDVYGSFAPGPGDKADVVYSPTPLIKMQPIVCGLKKSLANPKKLTDADIKEQETIYPRGAYVHPRVTQLKLAINRLDYTGDYIKRSLKMIEKKRAKFFILPESFRIREYLKSHENLICSHFALPIAMHLSFAPNSPWIEKIVPLVPEYPAKVEID